MFKNHQTVILNRLNKLDEMGHTHILLDEMGLDEKGINHLGLTIILNQLNFID